MAGPIVAIVGRPNVGKSTLFNRLVGSRRTITAPTPGVTRDPVHGRWRLADTEVQLCDTGGYVMDSHGLEAEASDRSVELILDSDVVLLVLDVAELTPADESLIDLVRSRARHPILVVNKVDNEARSDEAWNYHRFGFASVVHVSAEHGRNLKGLEEEVLAALARVRSEDPMETGTSHRGDRPAESTASHASDEFDHQYADRGVVNSAPDSASDIGARDQRRVTEETTAANEPIRISLIGKPNTGKSTLLNALIGAERAIVSDLPGTTRDVIEGEFLHAGTQFLVVDTAGIRKKGRVSSDVEYYSVNRAIRSIGDSDVALLLVDATEGVTDQDKKIASQIIVKGRGLVIVLSKWDRVKDTPNALQAISDRTRFVFPVLSFAPICAVSALRGHGISAVLNTVKRVRVQLRTRVGTGELNRSLNGWAEQHPLPTGRGPRFQARYMTQISADPIKFLLFVNRVQGFPSSWLSYVRNQVRETYGLDSVPFSIELRRS